MKSDYIAYPPQLAADVELSEQRDGDRLVYVIGSASVGRFLLLRETEYRVLSLIDGSLTPGAICDEFKRKYGGTLSLATLTGFLARLDEFGILAGQRAQRATAPGQPLGQSHYARFSLFNPDRLFTRMVSRLRWVWTSEFVVVSILLMLATLLLARMNWAAVASYGEYTLREHYLAVFAATLLIGFTHEFAHGLTCKAFGGRVTEVGVLMIYYFVPALYCNVSGIHFIPKRSGRLWVIAAGVYWQVLVGTLGLLAWLFLAPHTLPADVAFCFFLGGVLDVFFNANPLIKLDGYYFLSQWLRLPNLMDRSRAYWRGLLRRLLFGERDNDGARWGRRERAIYATFGLLSFLYTVALVLIIVRYLGEYLINRFHLPGLLLTFGIALIYVWRPLKIMINTLATLCSRAKSLPRSLLQVLTSRSEGDMATDNSTKISGERESEKAKRPYWRRRLAPLTITVLIAAVLLMPWSASIGAYGTITAIPDREAIIRAPEGATLIALNVQPGQQVASGAVIGQMGNLELEEQIVQVQSELVRADADYERLLGELRASGQAVARADLQLRQREHEYGEINAEQRQINARRLAETGGEMRFLLASTAPVLASATSYQSEQAATRYPAALAVLQSDVDLRRARLAETNTNLGRARKLYAEGIAPRSELDAVETRASTLEIEFAAARDRLEAALIEHRRKHTNTVTEMDLARSDHDAERLQVERLNSELGAMRALIGSLEERRALLGRKRAQFELVTPRAGAVFSEELKRMAGQYFQKGQEICRVADASQLLVRIQVPEREIGDVRIGNPVRLKSLPFPDRVFRGAVSKIGGESERDEHAQVTYRVELTIENSEGILRPGMTVYARIDFDRRMVGRILLHKIKQTLRPELWML